MSLLSAIILASSHVTSVARADLYIQHMQSYLEGIRELFPGYRFHPNHHMALHIHKYLLQYGPVPSWWTFPFERIIGMLQRIPNNGKIGMLSLRSCHIDNYLLQSTRRVRRDHLASLRKGLKFARPLAKIRVS
jgi:hypothetical protein